MFRSRLLGVSVPCGSVLRLVGLMADHPDGRNTALTVESVRPWTEVVLSDGHTRYVLELLHDGAARRCAATACSLAPLTKVVDWCRDHLGCLGVPGLTSLAAAHGRYVRWAMNFDWPQIEGDTIAAWLVDAGAFHGDANAVINAYLHAAFEEPEMIDAMYPSDRENQAVRQAMCRERLRLAR